MTSKTSPKGEPYPIDSTTEKWAALPNQLTDFEKAFKAATPVAYNFSLRVEEFVKSSLFLDLQRMAEGIMEAEVKAELLSTMIRSEDEDLGSIEKYITANPVNALTLMAIISYERKREASKAEKIFDENAKAVRVQQGKKGAETVHSRKGGSRDKRAKIQEIWASGKYTSRDICAEQECAALGMSFSTARKALRGTPEPSRH